MDDTSDLRATSEATTAVQRSNQLFSLKPDVVSTARVAGARTPRSLSRTRHRHPHASEVAATPSVARVYEMVGESNRGQALMTARFVVRPETIITVDAGSQGGPVVRTAEYANVARPR
jgi:hypothetical protein